MGTSGKHKGNPTKLSELEAVVLGLIWAEGPCTAYSVRLTVRRSLSDQWSGSAGAGLSLTAGNTNTTDLNLSFDAVRDPQTGNLIKFGALYVRGSADDEVNKDRAKLYFRDDYELTEKLFLFGSAN